MERKQRRENYRQTCETVLNDRDNYFEKLQAFEDKHGYIPEEDAKVLHQYAEWKKKGSWKNDKKLMRKINRRSK